MEQASLHFTLLEMKKELISDNCFLKPSNWSHTLDLEHALIKYCALQIQPILSSKICAVERV